MSLLTPDDWKYAHPYYGKTLRVHRVDLNDPTTIPPSFDKYRAVGAFRACPALNVKLKGQDGRYLPLDGVLVIILGPKEGGDTL